MIFNGFRGDLGWIWRGFGADFKVIWVDFHGILDDWPLTRKIWAKIVLKTVFRSDNEQ